MTDYRGWRGFRRELWERRWIALAGAVIGGSGMVLLTEFIRWCRGFGFFR